MEIYRLETIPDDKLDRVGGKAKGLSLLAQAGVRIAEGFVITEIENEDDLNQATEYYLNSSLGSVAVRSSANHEDGADFSNAGQYRTYLEVSGAEDFKKSVMACVSSLESNEAISYAHFFNQSRSNKMSIVVQKMVNAQKAGVCFTVDPTGDKETMLVEAVEGLGESLVSGQNTAIQYRVNKHDIVNGGRQSLARGADPLLHNDELLRICEDSLRAVDFFNIPLDTEWAIDKNGELLWLQARPITSLEEVDIHEFDPQYDMTNQVLTTCNISEMMPGAVTPLTISTSVYAIDWGLRKMCVIAGASKNLEEIPPRHFGFSIGNHLFLNLSSIYRLEQYVLGTNRQSIELSLCGRVLEDEAKPQSGTKRKVNTFKAAWNGFKYVRFLLSRNKARKKLHKMAADFRFVLYDTIEAQYDEIDRHVIKENTINLCFLCHYITSAHSGAMSSALSIMLTKDLASEDQAKGMIAGALENIEGIESVDILRSLRKIVRELCNELPDAPEKSRVFLLDYMKNGQGKSHEAYMEFMSKHGHRAILEAEMSSKGWREDEDGFMDYLTAVLPSKGIEPQRDVKGYNPYAEFEKKYSGMKLRIFKYLINQSRTGVVNREASKSSIIRIVNQLKIGYNRLADMMVAEGVFSDPTLIYFLTHQEIGQLAYTRDAKLVKKALQRKRLYEEQKTLVFKDVYYGRPVPIVVEQKDVADGHQLQGTPISRGMAKGKARIVKSIEDANSLQKGEIMVASFTDIGWSPYYCTIEALITEVGSVLSHGAVVAREYALPLVSNVAHATQVIKDGDLISVNGVTGVVTILEQNR